MNKHDFEQARKLYPGRKRGFEQEWENFRKKYGMKMTAICPLLKPAIEAQIAHRTTTKEWCPQWKHFATWISGGWWTEVIPQTRKPKPNRCRICDNTDVVASTDGKGWRCWRAQCIEQFARL